ncbi:DUF3331 domain-containing protein [Paraburkholderia sp.]|uniref:DUF3331 domain-containing protein n=1 Tax=Paraburkholderia sp. TaxID=1926495 RepID=UPI0025D68407|nr:DUF3331 domain-containing protein [Paraburkholderia sp.]
MSAKSRSRGHCALTGCSIRRGDRVYRPQRRGENFPLSYGEMILAASLDKLIIGSVNRAGSAVHASLNVTIGFAGNLWIDPFEA